MEKNKLKGGSMERKYTLGIVALAMIALLGVSLVSAMGFGNGQMSSLTDDEKAVMQADREAMQTAVQNSDYATWKSLMEKRIAEMQSRITEDEFNNIVARHQERQAAKDQIQAAKDSGDFAKVQELRQEYGISNGQKMNGMGKSSGERMNAGNCPIAK